MIRPDPAATFFVTRPRSEAEPLCAALRARGREAVAYPVLAIEPVDDDAILRRTMAGVDAYRLAIFVSPNAIRHAIAARGAPWPPGTAIGVMGPGSVATLAAIGVEATIVAPAVRAQDDEARFDSEALFAALDESLGMSEGFTGRVLIVRGSGGREWLADRLRSLGIAVDEVEAYRRVRPEPDAVASAALQHIFATKAAACFVVTSSEGLDNLGVMVASSLAGVAEPDAARAWLHAATILAPHRRIVEKARGLGFTAVVACGGGDAGILAAIE